MNFKEWYEEKNKIEENNILEGMDVGSIALMTTTAILLGGLSLYPIMKGMSIANDVIDGGIDAIIKKIKGKNKYKKEMQKVANGELKITKASQIISKDKTIKNFVKSFWEDRKKGGDGKKHINDLKSYIDDDLTPKQTKEIAVEIMKVLG
jgi:hypothetical protein